MPLSRKRIRIKWKCDRTLSLVDCPRSLRKMTRGHISRAIIVDTRDGLGCGKKHFSHPDLKQKRISKGLRGGYGNPRHLIQFGGFGQRWASCLENNRLRTCRSESCTLRQDSFCSSVVLLILKTAI